MAFFSDIASSSFVEGAKNAISKVVDAIVAVITPVVQAIRKVPGVDKLLNSIALNGPRYGTVAAAFIAKFVSDKWEVDLGEVTIPGVDWVWDVTSILSILIAFTIGYVIQKVLTLPRVEVYEGPAADIAGAVVGDVTEVVENDIPTDGVDDSRLVVELGPAEDGLDPNYDDPWGDPNDGNDLLPIPGRDIDDDDDEPDEDFYPEYYEGDPTDGFEFQHDEDAPPNEEL